jgi:hypothetical protein
MREARRPSAEQRPGPGPSASIHSKYVWEAGAIAAAGLLTAAIVLRASGRFGLRVSSAPTDALDESGQGVQQLLEQVTEDAGQIHAVQERHHRAEQVPEQVAWARLGRDVEVDLAQLHTQSEQVEIKRTELQIQDRTAGLFFGRLLAHPMPFVAVHRAVPATEVRRSSEPLTDRDKTDVSTLTSEADAGK